MLNRLDHPNLSPDDLQTCKRVFERLCSERNFDHTSEEAEHIAPAVIRHFQEGHMDEGDLWLAVRMCRTFREALAMHRSVGRLAYYQGARPGSDLLNSLA
ncbi:hypothetical protein EOA13_10045 [Mesorhizobium sp. M7A.F.Ca.US.011.01.1.1]|uniref:hypothetical protein n=1 Tax=unclassified Mesorhizobium TaxID=325217 RepID=UPI000FCBAB6A|nr:hypothetical protein [Mesorhizobium sp. M7A.F.Ca.US.011.01.1.1]RUX30137.1 hypothetical protein EOA13_10045 [Mesorhizobium sp. M7A.F.Ca.US.011.01.1.1]